MNFRLTYLAIFLISNQLIAQSPDWRNFISEDQTNTSHSSYQVIEVHSAKGLEEISHNHQLIRRLDENHFIIRIDKRLSNGFKTWNANNSWKLNLADHKKQEYIYIKVTKDFDASILKAPKVCLVHPTFTLLQISVKNHDLAQLTEHPEVLLISEEGNSPKTESRVIDMNLNPNRVNKIHHFYPELQGQTETISIKENHFDQNDIDLLNRAIETGLESPFVDVHTTEIATIIAGAGNSFVTGLGVAGEASLTSSDFITVLPDNESYYSDYGVKTQNHSYGTEIESFYGIQAEAFDLSANENPDLLHVFSSGNEGLESSQSGSYAGIDNYANLTGNFKMSKNTLSVGSVDTVKNSVIYSSAGPAYDGRIKPEIVAYSVVGSSNSAALISGISALINQRYKELHATNIPSALAKSILITSAEDVGDQGLDFRTGFGSVNAYRAMVILEDQQFLTGTVSNDEVIQFELNLPTNAMNLKVTLCWNDPAANAMDHKALVNDLDLRLIHNETTLLPWILDHSPSLSALQSQAIRAVDRLNNVEQVTVQNPGNQITVEVEGFEVIGNQDFYISYQYDIQDHFEWDFPTGSDNMPYNGETGSYFRWTTTLNGNGHLEYSVDDGVSWITLEEAVDLTRGYWRWSNPPDLKNSVIARMISNETAFQTDVFTVSPPLKAGVGFNCSDSLMLRWENYDHADGYTVFNLGEQKLEEWATISDTFLIVTKSDFDDNRFAVRPNLPSENSLLPSPTFDYSLQGVDCFVSSFFQEVALDTGIYLNLRLGTIYGIEEITFYRSNSLDQVEISNTSAPSETIRFLDPNPNQGYNEHTAVVRFSNNEELELTAGTSFYLTEVPVRLFPNPVSRNSLLKILRRELNTNVPEFSLFDSDGNEILRIPMYSTEESIPLKSLQPGLYLYILRDGGKSYGGKVLISP